jgi:phosphoserine phosphatase
MIIGVSSVSFSGAILHRLSESVNSVVVLAPVLPEEHLRTVAGRFFAAGHELRRCGRVHSRPGMGCSWARFECTGELHNLRAAAQTIAATHAIDIAVLAPQQSRFRPQLAAFDMDSTLIEMEGIDELAKLAGVGEQVAGLTAAAMRGEIDFQESFRQRISLLHGLDEKVIANRFTNIPVSAGAVTLITHLKESGCKTAVISGGFSFIGERLKHQLDIDYMLTNKLVFVNGRLSGIDGDIIDGAGKASHLVQLVKQQALSKEDVLAVGDGANDIPMLALAGLSVGMRPKARLRAAADISLDRVGLDGIIPLIKIEDE